MSKQSAICSVRPNGRYSTHWTRRLLLVRNKDASDDFSSPTWFIIIIITLKNSIFIFNDVIFTSSLPGIIVVLDACIQKKTAELEEFLARTCKECTPKPATALSLLHSTTNDFTNFDVRAKNDAIMEEDYRYPATIIGNQMRHLPTDMPTLDKLLGGGMRIGTVTELVGRAGAGKTQLALQLCVTAAKHHQGSIYIDTERKVRMERLDEISLQRMRKNVQGGNQQSFATLMNRNAYNQNTTTSPTSNAGTGTIDFNYKNPRNVLDNVAVFTPYSTQELQTFLLEKVEEEILNRSHRSTRFPIRLLIVDSIAAPLKRDFGSGSAPQRARTIFQFAQALKRLADQLHLAVVVINQVGLDSGSSGGGGGGGNFTGQGNNNFTTTGGSGANWSSVGGNPLKVRAALGTAWHHCVTTRLLLEREDDVNDVAASDDGHEYGEIQQPQISRRLSIVKSNCAPLSSLFFGVDSSGLVETSTQPN